MLAPPTPAKSFLLTAADLAVLPSELSQGPVRYELEDGTLIIMPVPGDPHGAIQLRLGAALYTQGEERGHGKAWSEVGVILKRNPDGVVGPDACFVVTSRLPVVTSPEGFLETIPDIVAEIRSKNDSVAELLRKKDRYLAAGVRVVWLVDPLLRTVTVCGAGQPPAELREPADLLAEPFIPGFCLPLAKLFAP